MHIIPFLRAMDIILVAVLLAVVAWTFKVTTDSQVALDRVADLRRQLEAEKIEIDLLKSDWGLLTSPQRLEQLVERYKDELDLQQINPAQISNSTSLPPLQPTFDPQAVSDKFAGTDFGLKTGSVDAGGAVNE